MKGKISVDLCGRGVVRHRDGCESGDGDALGGGDRHQYSRTREQGRDARVDRGHSAGGHSPDGAHPSPADSQPRAGVAVGVTNGEGHTTAIRQPFTTSPLYLYLEDGIPTRATGFFNHNALL